MNLDPLQCLEALDHYDIHVARSAYVDSAEGAIAFAARRTARDERMVPIDLRIVHAGPRRPDSRALAEGPLEGEEAIRRGYEALAARSQVDSGERILAQEAVDGGTHLAIDGWTDERKGRMLRLRAGDHGSEARVPLGEDAAAAIVRDAAPYGHRIGSEHVARMLQHVLQRASTFFEETGVDGFVIDPLIVHENSYTVTDADASAPHALHLKERLGRHARDKKEYGFRPSGRQ